MSQKLKKGFDDWLSALGIDWKTAAAAPTVQYIFHPIDVRYFVTRSQEKVVVDSKGKSEAVWVPLPPVQPVTIDAGSKSYKFVALEELLLWYAYCTAKQRVIRRHGTSSYVEGGSADGIGAHNRSYYGRIPEHYRKSFGNQKDGLTIIRSALEKFYQLNGPKQPFRFYDIVTTANGTDPKLALSGTQPPVEAETAATPPASKK